MLIHIFAGVSFLFAGPAHAQTLTMPAGIPLTTATVSAAVNYDSATDIFAYDYSISNSKQSVGVISAFYIDISTSAGTALSSTGLINSASGYSGFGSATKLADTVANATVPVGFKSQPLGWDSGPTAQFTAGWFGPLPPGTPVSPGQSLNGFVLTSPGLPGIRHFTAKPRYDPDDFFSQGIDDVPDAIAQQIVDLDNEIQRVIQSQGYTVGPVQPPSLTDVSQLIAFVAALKHQAASLQWICGRKFVDELDEALDRAGAAYVKGRYGQARGELRSFVSRLKDRRHGHGGEGARDDLHSRGQENSDKCSDADEPRVSDQAYFMLKADVDYILTKLPAPKDGGDHDREKERR